MKLNVTDILECHESDRTRVELDELTKEFKTAQPNRRKFLVARMMELIEKLERHNKAMRLSMLIPIGGTRDRA